MNTSKHALCYFSHRLALLSGLATGPLGSRQTFAVATASAKLGNRVKLTTFRVRGSPADY